MAQPRHQLSLDSLRCQHAATDTSSVVRTVPYAKLHPRHVQGQAPVSSESVYRTNCFLQALTIHFRVSTASGFVPAEPPTMARPRHQLSLGFLHCQSTATGTSSAMPCAKLSLELPRRTRSDVTGASLQHSKSRTTPSTMPP